MTTYEIELNNEYANQEFDGIFEEIQTPIHILLQTINNITFMSIFVNNEQIGEAFACFPNRFVIPYRYMINLAGGNFIFETQDDNYPNYENFNITCILNFVTKDELINEK